MYQFKSTNTLKETLKFGKPKSPNSIKNASFTQSKNLLGTSFNKDPQTFKPPTNYWKKGTTSTFPARPQTTYQRSSIPKPLHSNDSMPLSEIELNLNIPRLSLENQKHIQISNPISLRSEQVLPCGTNQFSQFKPLTLSCVEDRFQTNQRFQLEVNNLKHKLSQTMKKRDQFQKNLTQVSQQLLRVKELNRDQCKKLTQMANINNQLQADLFVMSSKLRQKQQSFQLPSSKQNDLKRLIVQLSQQKNELINKMSTLLQQKAKRDNIQTFNKIQKSKIENQLQNTRIQQLQQIHSLKSRVNELQQQSNPNEKQYYEQRIRLLQKQVKQLLLKCMSSQPSSYNNSTLMTKDSSSQLSQLRLMVQNHKNQMNQSQNYIRCN